MFPFLCLICIHCEHCKSNGKRVNQCFFFVFTSFGSLGSLFSVCSSLLLTGTVYFLAFVFVFYFLLIHSGLVPDQPTAAQLQHQFTSMNLLLANWQVQQKADKGKGSVQMENAITRGR